MDAALVAMRSARHKGGYPSVPGGGFTEDAPRPPVPGEEGELAFGEGGLTPPSHAAAAAAVAAVAATPLLLLLPYASKSEASVASTPRRPDLDLGYEPEGSASPTPPYVKWAESLHCLLDDQEGIHLFARFLKREGCGDLLDFWFACSGFRKLEASGGANREKKLKLAKAIYRKYVLDGDGIVSRRIRPPTRCFIRDRVAKLHVDPAMFQQAQTEVQATMEENAYPLFLKSDLYLEYARTGECGGGGESPRSAGADHRGSVPGNAAVVTSSSSTTTGHYLPTLAEDEEWRAAERESSSRRNQDGGGGEPAAACIQVTQRLLAETASQRVASGLRFQDSREYRRAAWPEPALPYYVNSGYAMAPAASANDSEQQSMSSDADTVSLTDSSLDGVPPYRNRKQHRREMHESAKANGRVPLPHIPRTHRIPKDIHVEPGRFAADLISRLEAVQRERDAQERLEERLKRVRLDDDDLDGHAPKAPPANHRPAAGAHCQQQPPPHAHAHAHTHYALLLGDAHEENPESILDDHVQRVMRTPGGQSPGTGRHSPVQSRSPDGLSSAGRHAPKGDAGADFYASKSRNYADGMSSVSADPGGHSTKGSAALCKRALKKGEDVPLGPPEELERNHKILLWMMEGEKESGRHKRSPYGSAAGNNNNNGGGVGGGGAISNARPSHPFIQDPTMPPNLAPNPLTQLEEVRRRLEEESIRGGATAAAQQPKQRHKAARRQPSENTTVAYYFCGEPIPYRTSVKGRVVTLGQFKELLTKRGSYRFYFKKLSDEFDCGVVFEEVREDHAILPIFEEKIIGKVEKID